MPAPPSKNDISGSGATPSNAQARAGFGAMHDNLYGAGGLLGATGLAVDARNSLGIGSVFSFRNLLINGNFAINQRAYATGVATTVANQYTLDRWRIPTSGQNATFGAASPDRTVTFPASGGEQVIEGAFIVGGIYTLSWTGAATATVNGAAITNGGNTASLPANTNVAVKFVGAVGQAQFELGTVATPFERRHPGIEFALCQRYYETQFFDDQSYFGGGTNVFRRRCKFSVTKRVTPTMFTSGIAEANASGTAATTPMVDGFTHTYAIVATGIAISNGTAIAVAEI